MCTSKREANSSDLGMGQQVVQVQVPVSTILYKTETSFSSSTSGGTHTYLSHSLRPPSSCTEMDTCYTVVRTITPLRLSLPPHLPASSLPATILTLLTLPPTSPLPLPSLFPLLPLSPPPLSQSIPPGMKQQRHSQ